MNPAVQHPFQVSDHFQVPLLGRQILNPDVPQFGCRIFVRKLDFNGRPDPVRGIDHTKGVFPFYDFRGLKLVEREIAGHRPEPLRTAGILFGIDKKQNPAAGINHVIGAAGHIKKFLGKNFAENVSVLAEGHFVFPVTQFITLEAPFAAPGAQPAYHKRNRGTGQNRRRHEDQKPGKRQRL